MPNLTKQEHTNTQLALRGIIESSLGKKNVSLGKVLLNDLALDLVDNGVRIA